MQKVLMKTSCNLYFYFKYSNSIIEYFCYIFISFLVFLINNIWKACTFSCLLLVPSLFVRVFRLISKHFSICCSSENLHLWPSIVLCIAANKLFTLKSYLQFYNLIPRLFYSCLWRQLFFLISLIILYYYLNLHQHYKINHFAVFDINIKVESLHPTEHIRS